MLGRKDKTTILVVASDILMGRVVNQALRHAGYMVGDVLARPTGLRRHSTQRS